MLMSPFIFRCDKELCDSKSQINTQFRMNLLMLFFMISNDKDFCDLKS